MTAKPEKNEAQLNLECIVCDKFTGGPVLCTDCLSKREFRKIGDKIPGVGQLVTLLMEIAYDLGKDNGSDGDGEA